MPTATINVFTIEPFLDFGGTFDLAFDQGDLIAEDGDITPTRIDATVGEPDVATRSVAVLGSGFAFAGDIPTGGTITGFEFHLYDSATQSTTTLLATLSLDTGISLVDFAVALEAKSDGDDGPMDALIAGFGEFVLDATAVTDEEYTFEDDVLDFEADTTAIAGAGGSYMELGTGADTYIGGTGFDQISFDTESGGSGVFANLGTGEIVDTYGNEETASGTIESLRGSRYDDELIGDDFRQQLRGLEGDDILNGAGGQDVIRYDRDVNNGGQNGVTISLMDGIATDGFGDTDTLISIEDARGTIFADVIEGDDGANNLQGLDGDDTIAGFGGNDTLDGGDGIDYLVYSEATGAVEVYLASEFSRGADGRDTLMNFENVLGSDFDDRLIGDNETNTLIGGDGDDVIKGKGGEDLIGGEAGDDTLFGGDGSNDMYGGSGGDFISALAGEDLLVGGTGGDFLYGGRDDDVLVGGEDGDLLRGNRGNDELQGDEGEDILRGGGNNDSLHGGDDDDELFGENGRDTIDGGAGDDILYGAAGGGVGDNTVDTFVFSSTADGGGGFDQIRDFEDNRDLIDLSSFGFTDFSEVEALVSDRSSGMRIDFGSGDVLFLTGFDSADFDASDVIL